MSSAEPPAGRRPDGAGAPHDTPPAGRPMSRNDLFGPGGPFKMSGTPAAPRGAGAGPSGYEPPDGEPTRAMAADDEPTRAVPTEPPHPRDAADVGDDRTQVYAPPPSDRTQVYPGGDYRPGQYQPRSMGPDAQDEFQQAPYRSEQYQPGEYQPGQYQPGQYQPRETLGYPGDGGDDSGSWYGQGGPPPESGGGSRPWVIAAVVALLVLAAGAGGAYALFGTDTGNDTASQTGASTSPTAAPSAEETTAPQESETAEPTETPEATEASFEPIPGEPWTDKKLDFGYLTNVVRSGDEVRLTFNRASFFFGDEATEKNGGVPPDNDYFIEDTSQRVRTFTMVDGASIQGSALLGGDGGDSDLSDITADELVENAGKSLDSGIEGIPVWLRHERGKESDVTALAEQFIP